MSRTYWHFVRENMRLGFDDGRKVVLGKTYKVKCEPELCERGLHASRRLIDALTYAPGPILCKVELGGTILHGDDKSVATERRVVAIADCTNELRVFSRRIAWDVWKQHFTTDPKDDKCGVVIQWLKTGDEDLRSAAESAAWSAAESAAWSAAESALAAWSAAAARSAAWSAAESALAAWSAAWSAAESALAARSEQNRRLLALIRKADWKTI